MKNVAALWLAGALVLVASVSVAAQKKGDPPPLSADAFAPFLGSWYSVPYDCDDCAPWGLPMTEVATVIVSQDSKGLSVALRDEGWTGRMGVNGYPEVGHYSSHSTTTDLTLVDDGLRCLIKGKGEVMLRRITADKLQVEVHPLDKKTIGGAVSTGTSTYTNDPAPIKEAIARHPGGGGAFGFLSEVLGGLAQMPVPQARIPQQTASAPPAQPETPAPAQSRYPGVQTAGGAASQPQPQYPVPQPVGGATSQQQQSGGVSSSSSEGPSSSAAHPVDAGDFNRCISVQEQPNGNVGLVNRCNQNMNVHFCVANANYPMGLNCASGGGLDSASANGGFLWLPDYRNSGGGRIYWGACAAPTYPQDWQQNGATYSFQCR